VADDGDPLPLHLGEDGEHVATSVLMR